MSDHLHRLVFGLAAAIVLPGICFVLGMTWSKLVGGWGDLKFRKWWTTFCLILPFVFVGMMIKKMAKDNFGGLRALWAGEPIHLIMMTSVAVLLSVIAIGAMIRTWHTL